MKFLLIGGPFSGEKVDVAEPCRQSIFLPLPDDEGEPSRELYVRHRTMLGPISVPVMFHADLTTTAERNAALEEHEGLVADFAYLSDRGLL